MRRIISCLLLLVSVTAMQAQDSAVIYYRLANKKFNFDKYKEAEIYLDKSIQLKPTDSAYILKSLLHYKEKELEMKYLDTAIMLNPSAANYVKRGNNWYNYESGLDTTHTIQALNDYEEAIRIAPDSGEAYYRMAMVIEGMNRREEAILFYDKAYALHGLDSCHVHLRGFTHFRMGHYAEALRDLEDAKSCGLQSEQTLLSATIAKCKFALGDTADACTYIVECSRRKGGVKETFDLFIKNCAQDKAAIFFWQGYIDVASGNRNAAIHSFNRSIQLSPSDSAYIERARLLKNPIQSIADLDTAIILNPKNADAYVSRGMYKIAAEMEKSALKDFDIALNMDSTIASAYWLKAQIYKTRQQYGKAMELYNAGVRVAPDNHFLYRLRGNLFQEMKNYEAAIADYTKALQYKSTLNVLIYKHRAECKEALGDMKGACEDLAQQTGSYPDNRELYLKKCDY